MAKSKKKRKSVRKHPSRGTRDHALAVFYDILENKPHQFVDYLVHCGISDRAIVEAGATPRLFDVIAEHYRIRRGVYDIDRVAADLARWLAPYIEQLKKQHAADGVSA